MKNSLTKRQACVLVHSKEPTTCIKKKGLGSLLQLHALPSLFVLCTCSEAAPLYLAHAHTSLSLSQRTHHKQKKKISAIKRQLLHQQ